MALIKVVTVYETWVRTPNETAEELKDRIADAVSNTMAFQQNVGSILRSTPNLDVSADSQIVNVSSNTSVEVFDPEIDD